MDAFDRLIPTPKIANRWDDDGKDHVKIKANGFKIEHLGDCPIELVDDPNLFK